MSRPSSRSVDLAVVGGGVIGLAVAWRAAQRGLRVAVLERGGFGGGTSAVAAGMIAPISEARTTEKPLLELGLRSARAYPSFIEELSAASGSDPGYLSCGTVAVARDPDEALALDRELDIRPRLGLEARRLRPSEARRLEPGLAPALRLALEIPDDHAIDPHALTSALALAAANAGVDMQAGVEVEQLEVGGGRVEGVRLAGGELLSAGDVVIAAGVWSDSVGGLPDDARVPIRPVKGQILALHDPAGSGLLRHALRTAGAYVAPRGDGRYVLGATVEERGFDTTVTAGAVFELLRDASEVLPGISELVIDELRVGLRPATPDNAPALGPGALDGLHWATGHYRHGILLTPVSSEIVVGRLLGDPVPELAAPFSPARFASTQRDPSALTRASGLPVGA